MAPKELGKLFSLFHYDSNLKFREQREKNEPYVFVVVVFDGRYAIVEELCGLGAKVHTCSRNEAELSECLSHWHTKGFRVTGSVCDVLNPSQREELIHKVSSLFDGKLNILVSGPPCTSKAYCVKIMHLTSS